MVANNLPLEVKLFLNRVGISEKELIPLDSIMFHLNGSEDIYQVIKKLHPNFLEPNYELPHPLGVILSIRNLFRDPRGRRILYAIDNEIDRSGLNGDGRFLVRAYYDLRRIAMAKKDKRTELNKKDIAKIFESYSEAKVL